MSGQAHPAATPGIDDDAGPAGAIDRAGADDAAYEPDGLELPDAGDDDTPAPDPDAAAFGAAAPAGVDDAVLASLIGRIVRQDDAALTALYRASASRVYRQALKLVRDAATAEEVVEDVYWQVWRQAPRFDAQRGNVLAWLMQITRSRAIDALRTLGRSPLHLALQIDHHEDTEPDADEHGPAQRLSQAQLARCIDDAMRALDPLRRQLVALAYQGGYSQSEIAEQTGLPLGTVKSHLRRALATMKEALAAGWSSSGRAA